MSIIPYGRQDINQSDIEAVIAVLRSDFLTQGPAVPAFEQTVARYCNAQHAVAVNSATSALHIACLALGVGDGDIVWTSPITFVASANCALYCGATVDFVDIDPRTYNFSVDRLAEKLVGAERAGKLPKVVIPVHLCGQPCDMENIYALSQKYGFKIIEDASHAIGGKYKGEPIGNCRYSDITVFSFHPVKIITTGEGGMAVTNDEALANQMVRLRSHGITRNPSEMTHAPDGSWYYQQIELGFNYRMTDMQAALGLSQMQRLDEFVAKRHELSMNYDKLLKNLAIIVPWQHADSYSGLHLYVIRLPKNNSKLNHLEVFERLRAHGVGVNLHYIPVYRHPYYERMGFNPNDFPEAERYYAEAVTLPMYPALTKAQQQAVVNKLNE
jgi:UDP-4-amino-4,6-dideoxy-N-acetyl-beta-L-altrosamine transaminase